MRFALLALAVITFAAAPHAQVQEGLIELGGSASIESLDAGDDRVTVIQFSPSVGYFFTDALEAGIGLRYTKVEDLDASGDILLFGAYHFTRPGATTVPFLKAQVGTSFTDDSDVVFGGSGGAKFFFLPGGALTGEIFLLTDGDGLDVGAQAGVSIFL